MKQLRVILAGITALSACSGGREQRVPVNDRVAQQSDLTLPDTLSRKDTSVTLSSQSAEPATPAKPAPSVAQTPKPARARSSAVRHRSHPAVATPSRRRRTPRSEPMPLVASAIPRSLPTALRRRVTRPRLPRQPRPQSDLIAVAPRRRTRLRARWRRTRSRPAPAHRTRVAPPAPIPRLSQGTRPPRHPLIPPVPAIPRSELRLTRPALLPSR